MAAYRLSGWLGKSRGMKKYIIAICAALAGIAICTAFFICCAIPKNLEPSDYTIYVYSDGAAEIKVNDIGSIIQIQEEIQVGNLILKPGTVILPGDGKAKDYEYPRRDTVKGD